MEQKVDINLDSEELDNAIEKANRLAELLREVQQNVKSLSGTVQAQTREQMHERILKASNTKILRRQLELLAEYSRLREGTDAIPECSEAMVSIYQELIKAKCGTFGFFAMSGIALAYLLKRLFVKVT